MQHLDALVQELTDFFPQLTPQQQEKLSRIVQNIHNQQPDIPLDPAYQAQLLQQLHVLQSQAKTRKTAGISGWIRRYRTVVALVPLFALFVILGWRGNIFESPTPIQRSLTIPVATPQPAQDTAIRGLATDEQEEDGAVQEEIVPESAAQKRARLLQDDIEPVAPLEKLIEVADSVDQVVVLEVQDGDKGGTSTVTLHADSDTNLLQDQSEDDNEKKALAPNYKQAQGPEREDTEIIAEDIPTPSGIATLQAYIAAINAGQYDTAYSMLAERSKNLTSDIAWHEETAAERETITMDILEEYATEDAEHRYSFITVRLHITRINEPTVEILTRYSLRQDKETQQRVMHAKD